MKKIFILLWYLIVVSFSFGQNSEWLRYSTTSTIVIALASQGNYLWIGTGGQGLIRLDKQTGVMKIFNTTNSGLRSNSIKALAVDSLGNLWIGSDNVGLVKFDGENWVSISIPAKIDTIYEPYYDAHPLAIEGNKIWMGIRLYSSYPRSGSLLGIDAGLAMYVVEVLDLYY